MTVGDGDMDDQVGNSGWGTVNGRADGFKDAAPYVVLLLMLAVRPQGLFGTLGRKKV